MYRHPDNIASGKLYYGKVRLFFVLILLVFPVKVQADVAGAVSVQGNGELSNQLSEKAVDSIPDVIERLLSDNPFVALGLLDEIVYYKNTPGHINVVNGYDLTALDYSIILQHILPELVNASMDEEMAKRLFEQNADWPDAEWKKTRFINYLLAKVEYILAFITEINSDCQIKDIDVPLSRLLDVQDYGIQRRVKEILVSLRSRLVTPYLVADLKLDHSKKQFNVYKILQALERIGAEDAAEHIVTLLDDDNPKFCEWGVRALVSLNARQYKKEVFEAIKQNVDSYGIAVMVKWGDEEAIKTAIAKLSDREIYTRSSMADRLVELNVKEIVGPIIGFMENPKLIGDKAWLDNTVRRHLLRLICKLGPDESVPILRVHARGKENVASTAADGLGEIRAEEGVPELLALLDRKDTWNSATRALAKIGKVETIGRLISELKSRPANSHHAEALMDLAFSTVPDFYENLKELEVRELKAASVEDGLKPLGEKCRISITLSSNVKADDRKRIVAFYPQATAMDNIERTFKVLNYSGHEYTLLANEGEVKFVTIEEAYDYWEVAAKKYAESNH